MKIKEKINNNEKVKKFKEYKESFNVIWSNPKYHAAIKLVMWFIIILILAIIVRLKPTTNNKNIEPIKPSVIETNEKNVKDRLKEIKSYEAINKITTINTEELLDITYLNNEEIIKYNNELYYYNGLLHKLENNEYVEIEDNKLLTYFNLNNIYDLIKDKEEDYITKYKDNSYIVSYTIPMNEFLNKYNETYTEEEKNITIQITVKEELQNIKIDINNNEINTIIIDLKNINNIETLNIKDNEEW